MDSQIIKTVITGVPPKENSGESLTIITHVYDNCDYKALGKDGIFLNTEIILQSYGNHSSMYLCSNALTSKFLRDLANQIDEAVIEAKNIIRNVN